LGICRTCADANHPASEPARQTGTGADLHV
jgi:hypothetical protein